MLSLTDRDWLAALQGAQRRSRWRQEVRVGESTIGEQRFAFADPDEDDKNADGRWLSEDEFADEPARVGPPSARCVGSASGRCRLQILGSYVGARKDANGAPTSPSSHALWDAATFCRVYVTRVKFRAMRLVVRAVMREGVAHATTIGTARASTAETREEQVATANSFSEAEAALLLPPVESNGRRKRVFNIAAGDKSFGNDRYYKSLEDELRNAGEEKPWRQRADLDVDGWIRADFLLRGGWHPRKAGATGNKRGQPKKGALSNDTALLLELRAGRSLEDLARIVSNRRKRTPAEHIAYEVWSLAVASLVTSAGGPVNRADLADRLGCVPRTVDRLVAHGESCRTNALIGEGPPRRRTYWAFREWPHAVWQEIRRTRARWWYAPSRRLATKSLYVADNQPPPILRVDLRSGDDASPAAVCPYDPERVYDVGAQRHDAMVAIRRSAVPPAQLVLFPLAGEFGRAA